MRKHFVTCILILGLSSCQYADSQLKRGPNGEDSKLEQEVKAIAPAGGPYGQLAILLAGIAASAYGAFHAREANKQTDKPPVA
jgi:hypothetical protein